MQSDEQLYELSAKELAESPRQGLLIKCMAKSEGDENKGKALYIETRVSEMKIEILEKQERERQKKKEEDLKADKESTKDTPAWVVWFALSALVFFVFVMLTSCTKQEVYEFRREESYSTKMPYYIDKTGKTIDTNYSMEVKTRFMQRDYVHDNFTYIKHSIKVKAWAEFKFTPIDEDGFCFYSCRQNIYREINPKDRHSLDNEYIKKVLFFDDQENVLFTYPFEDSYDNERNIGNYDRQGKTKSVTRALLERVAEEKIEFRVNMDWEWDSKHPRRTMNYSKIDLSKYENPFSR